MPRIKQKQALRGSQKWLQILVNEHPHILSNQLANRLILADSDRISFLSPLKRDDYAEYNDEAFINKLGAKLTTFSAKFVGGQGCRIIFVLMD